MLVYLATIDSPKGKEKFERLYCEYAKYMYYVAYKVLKHHQDAEDAVHQAFLKVAETIDMVDGTICPRTRNFMAVVTEHKAIDLYRKKTRHPEVEYNETNVGLTVDYDGDNTLAECMSKLSDVQRQVLLLKHYHGYSSAETAKILDLHEGNVITIDYRAKKKLRALCQEEELL